MGMKRLVFIFSIIFIAVFLGGTIRAPLIIAVPVFAIDQKAQSNQLKQVELKSENNEKKINELNATIDAINKDIANYKLECVASKKLLEISDKNLTAPLYLIGIIISLIASLIALIPLGLYFVRRNIIKKINNEIAKINDTWTDHVQQFSDLRKEVLWLHAYSLHASMVDEWQAKNLDRAIKFGEDAVKFGIEVYGENPENFDNQLVLNRYRSDLAYVYAERGRTDKAGQAIEYAKKGLQSGRDARDLNLIDNFLFVVKTFSRDIDDMKLWIEVFKEFGEDIFAKEIRKGEEKEELVRYYNEISKRVRSNV